MAYFYKRIDIDAKSLVKTSSLTIPARHWIDGEKGEAVHCDELFKDAASVVLGNMDNFQRVIKNINDTNSNAARPRRDRKPVQKSSDYI